MGVPAHARIIPSQLIRRGVGPVRDLPAARPPVNLDDVAVARSDGSSGTLAGASDPPFSR
ncbi:MAG: hypothetical protein ABJA86_11510 [Nocardioidaceae bacterium]